MLAALGAVPLVAWSSSRPELLALLLVEGERIVGVELRLVVELLAVLERFVVREPPVPPEPFFALDREPPELDDFERPSVLRCSAIPKKH
jgi:hypothetical protein